MLRVFCKACIVILLLITSGIFWVAPAFAVEVGTGEPLAWGADNVWNSHKTEARIGLDKMQDLGVQWHREWVSWKDWQPVSPDAGGGLNQSAVELLGNVEALGRERNIQTYAMLFNAPSWANGSDVGTHIPGNGDPNNPEYQKFVEDYGNFVYEVVSTYRGRIDHWEIWNEPDMTGFWGIDNPSEDYATRMRQQAGGYTYMLQTAYRRAKEANPDSVIMLGGITTYTSNAFLPALYDQGAGPYFDIAAIHPYTMNVKPSASPYFARISNIRQTMDSSGDTGKPIWITETGWSTRGNDLNRTVSESQQSEYAIDTLNTVRDRYPSVQVLTFFRLMDRSWYSSTDRDGGSGMLYTNVYNDGVSSGHALYEPKPVFYAIKAYLADMSNPSSSLQLASEGAYWPNFADYSQRRLTVNFAVNNPGTRIVQEVSISGAQMSNGVIMEESVPLVLGDLAPGNTSRFRIRFSIPYGVSSFNVRLHY